MLFWAICLLLTVFAALVVLAPVLRAQADVSEQPDVAIYKAQLAEIDRDLAREVLDPAEAEQARAEIARRLLAASRTRSVTGAAPRGWTLGAALASLAVILAVSGASYWVIGARGKADQPLADRLARADEIRETRPGQAQLQALAPVPEPVAADPAYLETVAQLREIVPQRPDDLRGWELLAFHESELRNYPAAIEAQSRVIALLGDDAPVEERRVLLDLMVIAANGFVSPEAEALARDILETDPDNVAARYYLGELYAQTGRADLAFRLWRPIVETAPESFHTSMARAQIGAVAEMAGVRYSAPERRGPSMDQVMAAQDMSDEDRAAMILGMVESLSNRLATQGGGPQDWARLITAYGVLGDEDNARVVWTEARDVFGSSDEAMAILSEAARSAGLIE